MSRFDRLTKFCAAKWPELMLVAFGIALRLCAPLTYDVTWGYDYPQHWEYVTWVAQKGTIPSITLNPAAYHTPLFYYLAAGLYRLGLTPARIRFSSCLFASARLLLIWWGLERWLPERRVARLVAIATAAVMPASVHLDGMLSNEPLNNLIATAILVLLPFAFQRDYPRRTAVILALGALITVGTLTKVSALSFVPLVVCIVAVQLYRERRDEYSLIAYLRPWVFAAAIVLCGTGWFFVRNQRLYGKAFATGYDGVIPDEVASIESTPYLDRRTIGFLLAVPLDVASNPYWPTENKRFFSVLVASSFADYYNYKFSAPPKPGVPTYIRNGKPIGARGLDLSIVSAKAGFVIALLTTAAWFAAFRRVWRRLDFGRLALLAAPAWGVLGQLHFSIAFPNDNWGPVKGLYLQYVAPPLYAAFGLAIAWLWAKGFAGKLVALAGLAALACVASYTIYCRSVA